MLKFNTDRRSKTLFFKNLNIIKRDFMLFCWIFKQVCKVFKFKIKVVVDENVEENPP